jgi:protein-L-isoaspartate(D-aspartate) O-methyltransferase
MDKNQVKRLWQQMLDTMKKEGALETAGVEAAFSAVPRHLFLPNLPLEEIYSDKAISLKHDASGLLTSSSSQPSMMAVMLNQLELKEGDNVLEIGTASGYNAAIIKQIVGETGRVTSVEIDPELAKQAAVNLQHAKFGSVVVVNGDGAQGYSPRAAYDHILSTVGIWDVPPAWIQQLKPRGTIVAPIVIDGVQVSAKFVLQDDGTALSVDNRPCAFVYMLGQNAGPDFRRQVGSSSLYILADDVQTVDTVALHTLLSDDHEYCQLETQLSSSDFWYGFQLYLMIHEPPDLSFFVYSVIEGQQAYGLEGRGIALFARGTIAFAGYNDKGLVHCFAGSDAFIEMQRILDNWETEGRPTMADIRLRLIPKILDMPAIDSGKIYERRDNFLHVWIETQAND